MSAKLRGTKGAKLIVDGGTKFIEGAGLGGIDGIKGVITKNIDPTGM